MVGFDVFSGMSPEGHWRSGWRFPYQGASLVLWLQRYHFGDREEEAEHHAATSDPRDRALVAGQPQATMFAGDTVSMAQPRCPCGTAGGPAIRRSTIFAA